MEFIYLQTNVYEEAIKRIEDAILTHEDYYVSFSGGKDSGVLFNLVLEVSKKLNRLPVKVVFSDLEAIFKETERYVKSIMDMPEVEPYWMCLEEIDDNANSVYGRYFILWEKGKKWVRDLPRMSYVINNNNMPTWLIPHYKRNNVEEWTIKEFGEALCDKNKTTSIVNFIGLRSNESYGRMMNIRGMKNRNKVNNHTYQYIGDKYPRTWICLPLYDWKISDVWHYYSINNLDYNRVYDSMHRLGVPLSRQRTCFAFGPEQKNSLYMWSIIEPDTWDKMVTRVEGINYGKLYNTTSLGAGKIKKPQNLTWRQYLKILLQSTPDIAREVFLDKFDIIFNYHKIMYEIKGGIPFNVYVQDSRKEVKEKIKETGLPKKYFISYETLCRFIIKRDTLMASYGFSMSEKMRKIIENVFIEQEKLNANNSL